MLKSSILIPVKDAERTYEQVFVTLSTFRVRALLGKTSYVSFGFCVVLKEQVANFLGVTLRTVENYLERFSDELIQNGYEIICGKRLQELKLAVASSDVPESTFGSIGKTFLASWFKEPIYRRRRADLQRIAGKVDASGASPRPQGRES